jgi:ferredoxin
MTEHRHSTAPHRLSIDPIACTGEGLCADLLPELIQLDEWGYPIVSDPAVAEALTSRARAAVADCPRLALRLSVARQ